MTKVRGGLIAALSGLVLVFAAAPLAVAKDGDVLVRGTCTGSTTSKLKLSEENGRIEVEFEVDQNRNGVRWNVAIFRNGNGVARVTKVTAGRSGSFEARALLADGAGRETVRARATRASGAVCAAVASWR
jgi:hypothetical protein